MSDSRLSVVVGAQYGSEGKGAIAGHLSQVPGRPVTCVRVGGPNAGHTVLGNGPEGRNHPWRLQTIPVAAVTNHDANLVIAAGSEIEPGLLETEIELLEDYGHPVRHRLFIDSQATVLTKEHQQTETDRQMHQKIGSTGKGIGAARAARLMRDAPLWKDISLNHVNTTSVINDDLLTGHHIIIEGTQGYGLGLHAGHYPQCTSNDARAIDFLAMAGINPWQDNIGRFTIYAVARVYPIRVAGNSGPLHDETTWEELGLEPELTTVTRKTRRVGNWDANLVAQAVRANGGPGHVTVALTMLDHAVPEVYGYTGPTNLLPDEARRWISRAEQDTGARVSLVGTGPNTIAGSLA
jgi:adenylosuccinate synthase